MPDSLIVLDTSVLFAKPAAYEIEEIKQLAPAVLLVPYSVLCELDQLMQRTRERDRARSALNVIRTFVQRGAAREPVSCGEQLRWMIGSSAAESAPRDRPGIDASLADDRILCCALAAAEGGSRVTLATTEFALYAKALSAGIDGLYLEGYSGANPVATPRERRAMELAWDRLLSAQDTWAACRRALAFLRTPLVMRMTAPIRESGEPQSTLSILQSFDALSATWDDNTDLSTVMASTLGLSPPPTVDYDTQIIHAPVHVFVIAPQGPSSRYEAADERALRISAAEAARKSRDDYNVDSVLFRIEEVRNFVLDATGEED